MGNIVPPSIKTGDRITELVADSFDLSINATINPALFDVSREFAFSSDNVQEFAWWYQTSQVFSKFQDASLPEVREAAAREKFRVAEAGCGEANRRLTELWTRPNLNLGVWARAKRMCHSILGRFPLEKLPAASGFGPGASTSLRRKASSQQNKWVLSTHITSGAIPYYAAFYRWAGIADLPSRLSVVEGNTVTTVPKSYKTDRIIAIEPDWNCFFQKGVGRLLRQRLNRVGLLLPDAQEKHSALARLGSWTGSLATLDLSATSDSISLALCEALLPDDWWSVVQDLRSPFGRLDGDVVTYEKVSSMGNGFTFELETLLFYCLVTAVCKKEDLLNVSVYGDDIIVPTHRAEPAIAMLQEAGFSLNLEKSFWSGNFRESCGGHWWKGINVAPFYLTRQPRTVGDLIVLGNKLQEWATRFPSRAGCFTTVFREVKRHIPRFLWGPRNVDGVLWRDWDECRPKWRRDFQSYRQLTIRRKHRYADLTDHAGAYLFKLWVVSEELQASMLGKASLREEVAERYLDRDQWEVLPVRIA
jgi:hypothetical protein